MSRAEQAEARARCEAATPGPWCVRPGGLDPDEECSVLSGTPGRYDDVVHPGVEGDGGCSRADADFIAAARADLPAALDEIGRVASLLEILHRAKVEEIATPGRIIARRNTCVACGVAWPCPTLLVARGTIAAGAPPRP